MSDELTQARAAAKADDAEALMAAVRASGDPTVRWYALRALGERGDPEQLPSLLAWLDGQDDDETQTMGAKALGGFADPRAAARLGQLLAAGPGRYAAIESLERLGGDAAVEALGAGLSVPDEQVRARTAEALGRVGTAAAADAMERVLGRQRSAIRRRRLQRRIDRIRSGAA